MTFSLTQQFWAPLPFSIIVTTEITLVARFYLYSIRIFLVICIEHKTNVANNKIDGIESVRPRPTEYRHDDSAIPVTTRVPPLPIHHHQWNSTIERENNHYDIIILYLGTYDSRRYRYFELRNNSFLHVFFLSLYLYLQWRNWQTNERSNNWYGNKIRQMIKSLSCLFGSHGLLGSCVVFNEIVGSWELPFSTYALEFECLKHWNWWVS